MDSTLLDSLNALYRLNSRQSLRQAGLDILLCSEFFQQVAWELDPHTSKPCSRLAIDERTTLFFHINQKCEEQAELLLQAFKSHYLACGYETQTHALDQLERLSHIGYWRWHVPDSRVFYSPGWKAMLGYQDHEIKSDFSEWERLLHPDDRAESERQVAYFFSHPESSNISEFRMLCKDGQYRTIISKGRVVSYQDAQKNPDIIFGIHYPADELGGSDQDQQRLTTQLKRERTLRARAGEVADIGFWEVNIDSQHIYWNRKTREIHKVSEDYKPDINTAINFYKKGESLDAITRAFTECIEKGTPYDLELILIDAEGCEKWVRAIGIKDDSSSETRIFGLFQDIDERKRAVERLEQARQQMATSADRLALATNSAEIGVWEYHIETGALFWDKWMYEIYGISESDFPGDVSVWGNSLHPDDSDIATQALQQAIDGIAPFDCKFRIIRPDGAIRHIKAKAIVQRDDAGKAISMVGVNFDITQAQLASQAQEQARHAAEEANRAKSDFLASMSHELRTPMNGVLGMLQLMEGSVKQDINKRRLQIASNSAKNLLTILDDILDFSRIEAGKLELDTVKFSMAELLDSIKDMFTLEAEKQNTKISVANNLQHDLYWGDDGRIRQMLINLVGNANKFTKDGQITIQAQINDQDQIEISVTDTGIGIPQERLDNIFESFTQVDTSTTRKYGGSGLGLSICKRLCDLMGGNIRVRSELHSGSVFTISLPLEEASGNRIEDNTAFLPPVHSLDQSNILLVEDNEINQIVICDMLTGLDAHIETCENGKEAIHHLQSSDIRYDCILMDCQMPIMDGYAASRAIREGQAGAQFKHIPIIALTANAMTGDKEKCLDAGMSDYLTKPVDMLELQKVIGPFLKH